jgi:hypothetical protein
MSNPPEPVPQARPQPRTSTSSEEPVSIANDGVEQPVGRAWIVFGSLVILIGVVMGFVMSSLGK